MIIGKGGSFIKTVKDESGAFIQISQKSKDATLPERVVTIIGKLHADIALCSRNFQNVKLRLDFGEI